MRLKFVFIENWLTRRPKPHAWLVTAVLVAFMGIGQWAWLPVSGVRVSQYGEFWRAWTALFVHADAGHLLSNLFFFLPFSYFLSGYFHAVFFPFVGVALGGAINLLVIRFLPPEIWLLGASGLVYWMGATWITLAMLIDRRDRISRRILKGIAVSLLLFFPQTYRTEVSYLAHFVGFMLGIVSGIVYYAVARRTFRSAERYAVTRVGEPISSANYGGSAVLFHELPDPQVQSPARRHARPIERGYRVSYDGTLHQNPGGSKGNRL